jgi:hypothetical protein
VASNLPQEDLQFYRAGDPALPLKLARAAAFLTLGALFLLFGSLSMALGVPKLAQPICAVIGAPILLYGLFSAFISLPRALANDRSLTVRRDGLLFEGRGIRKHESLEDQSSADPNKANGLPTQVFFAWDDIQTITVERAAMHVVCKDGRRVTFEGAYAKANPEELTQIFERMRKRAELSIL